MKKQYQRAARFLILTVTIGICYVGTIDAADSAAVSGLKNRLIGLIEGSANASPKVKTFIQKALLATINQPAIASAVKAQNAKAIPLSEIQKIDREWQAAEDTLPIHQQMMNSPCAEEIRRLAKQNPAIAEAFVMDNQGANVCQNELTSDYWQGDEAKWKNAFKNGTGGIDIGVEKLDESTNIVLQQVSLPIVDNEGKIIGAICYGIKTGSL